MVESQLIEAEKDEDFEEHINTMALSKRRISLSVQMQNIMNR
jgi:hypothetical protein